MSVANNLTGKTLSNRYEILRPLGEGGMGKVYLAKDKRFGEMVVVKIPTMEASDKDLKDRFMLEIKSSRKLQHAHIVPISDWGEIESIPFLVLRYLSGGSLRDRITDAQGYYKPMPLEGLNQWLPQIASALDFIHTKNWVHQDLKPDNILFDEAGNPYLADFGIAKALEGAPMGVKTTMGAFVGTPQYMAPEMHLGEDIGPRTDQFGLAVLVYEALAGKIPFAGKTTEAIFEEIMQDKAKPMYELVPGISVEKSNALMKGITKEPRDRYGSCMEFANAVTGSMLARGSSSAVSETPTRVVIPRTRIETPKKADIPGTRIETPSKPEIAGTRIEKSGSRPDVRLRSEDYLRSEGLLLEELCKNLVASGKVTKELFLAARKFCKSNDVTGILGVVLLTEKIETIVKTGHVSKEISQEIVSLARDILGLGVPVIAGIRMETPSKPEIAGTRLERSGVKAPVLEQTEENSEEALLHERRRGKKGNSRQVYVLAAVVGWIALLGIILIIALGGKKVTPEVVVVDLGKGIKLEMVLIPAGKFVMGSPVLEKGRFDIEKQHEVTLTNPFYMGKYEVTQKQWITVTGNNPSKTVGDELPVTNVSWEDCQEFINKLNAKPNGGYRLPTEAEWEYACRAETSTAYSFGNKITSKHANFMDSKEGKPKEVGRYKPNTFGLYDMHGNVWEWCEDWLADYPPGAVTDPKGHEKKESRVLRGGSFKSDEPSCRSSYRHRGVPDYKFLSNGFRLAMTADLRTDPPTVNSLEAPFTETKAKEVQKSVAKILQKEVEEKVDLGKGIKLEMVLIPAGKFVMGSPGPEVGRKDNETQHEVILTNPFYMGKYEVTQEQWEKVMENNDSETKGAKLPVTNVSWEDCQGFIRNLNAITKDGGYRLPTEAEWEYACRAGTNTAYSFGDALLPKNANISESKNDKPVAVGRYDPNKFGLHDMHGNVREWCEDWLANYPPGAVTDPTGPANGELRILRGGSFLYEASRARSSERVVKSPPFPDYNRGFRLARTP